MVSSSDSRSCDVLVFGATGFTGKFVLKELLSQVKAGEVVRVGAAGRSKSRVIAAVDECLAATGVDLEVAVIEADVKDEASLISLAASARILLNCVGPYRKYGPPVVKACVENGTHYLDICGEPEFIEKCELEYGGDDGLAAKNKCFVVSGCGFDSIPCDLGTLHNQETMREKGLIPSSVESFLTINSGPAGAAGHYATWEALVLGFSSVHSLRCIRKALKERWNAEQTLLPIGPKPKRTKGKFDPRVGAYTLPFLGSDASIVRRTQNALARSFTQQQQDNDNATFYPVHHSAMFTVKSKGMLAAFAVFGSVLNFLVKYKFGRSLLLKYPRFFSFGAFSHAGPSMQQIEGTSFSMTFFGKGKSAHSEDEYKTLVTKISGPEPGYLACSTFLTQAALTVLQEPSKLCPYGVRTTGELLFKTNYLDRLKQNGIGLQTLLSDP